MPPLSPLEKEPPERSEDKHRTTEQHGIGIGIDIGIGIYLHWYVFPPHACLVLTVERKLTVVDKVSSEGDGVVVHGCHHGGTAYADASTAFECKHTCRKKQKYKTSV